MITNKYKQKLKSFKGMLVSTIPKTHQDINLINDIQLQQLQLFKKMLNKDQKYSIRWLIGLERYIQSIDRNISKPFRKNLKRGHIVEVELFGHFNRELTFLHPAVVLFDNKNGLLLVAPISTPLYNDSNDLHIDVGVADGLKHNCAIALDEIQMIHKDRVVFQHKHEGVPQKVQTATLDKIDNLILKNFLPQTDSKVAQLNSDFQTQEALLQQLKEDNKRLEEESIRLQGIIKDLEHVKQD